MQRRFMKRAVFHTNAPCQRIRHVKTVYDETDPGQYSISRLVVFVYRDYEGQQN